MNINKTRTQIMLNINDNSHIGDIADLPDHTSQDDKTIQKLHRNGYIVLAGDRYILTGKALWR